MSPQEKYPILQPRVTTFGRITKPVSEFMHVESSSGILLAVCTAVALAFANSPLADAYTAFWDTHLKIGIGDFALDYPLWYWINDALMAIFFFVVGLEIKREIVSGELSEPRKIVLPVAAAFGGAALPALIYFAFVQGTPDVRGWAIPMATDIAFVVGFLAMMGSRVPHGLKIMLLSLAIVDDMIAVVVIAVFYTAHLKVAALALAVAGLVVVASMNRLGVRRIGAYYLMGAFVWVCALKSGVHPTVAGVLLGLMTPAKAWIDRRTFAGTVESVGDWMNEEGLDPDSEAAAEMIRHTAHTSVESISPLERLIHDLHPWVSFVIMPVFALANAAVPINLDAVGSSIAVAIAAGLVLGKPIGIFLTSFLTVKAGLAALPTGVNWRVILGAGFLAGIGFTMSLFVAGLSFKGETLMASKAGVLTGSAVSAILGLAILMLSLRDTHSADEDLGPA